MPTLNYDDIGSVLEYDYLQGTILGIYPDDDTADVILRYTVVTTPAIPATATTPAVDEVTDDRSESLSGVPIFYHCDKNSVIRGNGAIEGAAGGFKLLDTVVVLKSRTKDNSLGEEYYIIGHYDGVVKCKYELIFINLTVDYIVEFYKYDSNLKTTKLLKTYDLRSLSNWSPDNRYEYDLLCASSGMNCVVASAYMPTWRGNIMPVRVVHRNTFPVKIPISFYGDDKVEAGLQTLMRAHPPGNVIMSYSGMITYCVETGIMGQLGGFAPSPLNYFTYRWPTYPIEAEAADQALLGAVGNAYNQTASIIISAIGEVGDYSIMAYMEWQNWTDDAGVHRILYKAYFRVGTTFQAGRPHAMLDRFDMVPGYDDIPRLYMISQIVGYGKGFFVFYSDLGQLGILSNIEVEVFDTELNIIVPRKTILGVAGTFLSRVNKVVVKNTPAFCFRTSTTGPIYLVDIEKLTLIDTIPFIDSVFGYNTPNFHSGPVFLATDLPITNYFLDELNDYRFAQPAYCENISGLVDYYMPISYLGYSDKLEVCAKSHAGWCARTGVYQHEDENGDLVHSRAQLFGFRYESTGENLALVNTSVFKTEKDQIDEALRMWKASPGHNANLLNRDYNSMGMASYMYPESIHTIIVGPGSSSFPPGPLVIDPSSYGKMKIFVWNAAGA